jgi:hypothetical protein
MKKVTYIGNAKEVFVPKAGTTFKRNKPQEVKDDKLAEKICKSPDFSGVESITKSKTKDQ